MDSKRDKGSPGLRSTQLRRNARIKWNRGFQLETVCDKEERRARRKYRNPGDECNQSIPFVSIWLSFTSHPGASFFPGEIRYQICILSFCGAFEA